MSSYLGRGLQVLLFLVVAYYLGRHWQENSEKILRYRWTESFRAAYLAPAFLFLLAHFALVGTLLAYLLRSLGLKTGTREGIRVTIASSFGKYIPGKLWAAAGKVYLLRKHSSPALLFYVVVLETAFTLAAGALVSIPIIVFCLLPVAPGWALPALLALAVPWGANRTDWLATIFARLGFTLPAMSLPPRKAWIAFAGYVLSWGLFGAGFWFLINAVYPLPIKFYPHALASMTGGWIVGFLALVSPGGLGVREGVLLGLSKMWLPLEVATVVSLGARLWTTAAEVLALGLVYLPPFAPESRKQ